MKLASQTFQAEQHWKFKFLPYENHVQTTCIIQKERQRRNLSNAMPQNLKL